MKTAKGQKVALFVDDELEFIRMISDVVQHPHFEIRTCHAVDGYQAVDKIIKAKPDILFLDFALPKANAGEIMPMLKSAPELSGLPIYFITGYPTEEIFSFLRGLDFEGILVKGGMMGVEILNILNRHDR